MSNKVMYLVSEFNKEELKMFINLYMYLYYTTADEEIGLLIDSLVTHASKAS